MPTIHSDPYSPSQPSVPSAHQHWWQRSGRLMWKHLPFTVKLPLTFIVLVIATVISVTLLSLWREQQNFRSELETQAAAMLAMLTTSIDDSLYNLDVDALSSITRELDNDHTTLVFGNIYDAEGRTIASTLTDDSTFSYSNSAVVFETAPDPLGQRFAASTTPVFLWQADQLVAGQAVTAGNETLGAISIGLPITPLHAKMQAVQREGLLVALIAVIVGTALVLLVSRSLLRPVQEMAAATNHIARGNLQTQVPVRSQDELGMLAQSFNQMVDQVRVMMERQAQQQAELETLMHARSDAVRAVVHDLNHTVQAIQSAMDVWMMGLEYHQLDMTLIEPGRDRLQSVLDQQRDLLQDMRDAALLEAGKLVLQPEVTD
ncbi:MAG: HAMP domain-containing protein, partial [Chloroflexaceae bacterium]|nr:HAMP domain-containing protein [Chloroflexaceae bacterium]